MISGRLKTACSDFNPVKEMIQIGKIVKKTG